jgi:hypothetical protein
VRAVLSVLTVILMLLCTKLAAQALPPKGTPVRISVPGLVLENREGYLDAGRVLILSRGHPVAVPLSSVTKLERRELKPNATTGALIGFVVGLVAGSVTGTYMGLTAQECESEVVSGRCTSNGSTVIDGIAGTQTGGAWGSVVGGVLGTALGALIGASIKTDRWEKVPLDRLRVSFAPKRDGFALGLSVSF